MWFGWSLFLMSPSNFLLKEGNGICSEFMAVNTCFCSVFSLRTGGWMENMLTVGLELKDMVMPMTADGTQGCMSRTQSSLPSSHQGWGSTLCLVVNSLCHTQRLAKESLKSSNGRSSRHVPQVKWIRAITPNEKMESAGKTLVTLKYAKSHSMESGNHLFFQPVAEIMALQQEGLKKTWESLF